MMRVSKFIVGLLAFAGTLSAYHSIAGECSVAFPVSPNHVREKVQVGVNEELIYDAYIAPKSEREVYMMLIATFPAPLQQKDAKMSLEGFLRGMLQNNPQNKLIFSDIVHVDGGIVLEFFIESNQALFRGRAFVAKGRLYLLGYQSDKNSFHQEGFDDFVNSFDFE